MQFQVLGFNFTKISGERAITLKDVKNPKERKITTNIEFTDFEKESIPLLNEEAAKVSFKFSIVYEPKQAELSFTGVIILKADKEGLKNMIKAWKKKQLPPEMQVPLFNIILNRCTIKALQLEQDLNLPTHIPLPRLSKNPVKK